MSYTRSQRQAEKSAFPKSATKQDVLSSIGITKREYFANTAMGAIISATRGMLPKDVAKLAVLQSEALLEELYPELKEEQEQDEDKEREADELWASQPKEYDPT